MARVRMKQELTAETALRKMITMHFNDYDEDKEATPAQKELIIAEAFDLSLWGVDTLIAGAVEQAFAGEMDLEDENKDD